jgi:hypothetical protein
MWEHARGIYTALSYNQQIELHAFYQDFKDLDDDQAIAHRIRISKQQPSLPNRAGKAFKIILKVVEIIQRSSGEPPKKKPVPVPVPAGRRKQHIVLRPLARPEIDIQQLAEVLLDHMASMSIEERTELENKGRSAAA